MARTKPPVGTQVDWSHPSAQGLELAYLFNEGTGSTLNNLGRAGGANGTVGTAGTSWTTGQDGPALKQVATASTTKGISFSTARAASATAFTVEFWLRLDGTSDTYGALFLTAGGAGAFVKSTGKLTWTIASDRLSATTLNVGQWYQAVVVVSTATTWYVNGALDVALGSSSTANINAFTQALNDTSSETAVASLSRLRAWSRVLPASEIAALYADPDGMFRHPPVRRLFKASTGLTPGTVSVSAITSTTATYSGTADTGGTASFNYTFQRCGDTGSNAPSGSPSSDTGWTTVGLLQPGLGAGDPPADQGDSGLTAATKYWVRYKTSDANGTPANPYSAAVSFTTVASVTGTLGAQAQAATAAFTATNTPPAVTGTLGASAQAASVSLSVTNTPPATTGTLGAAAGPASVSFAALNVPPATTATLGASAQAATAAFSASNTPPGATTATLGAQAQAASVAFAVLNTPPAILATLTASAGSASGSFTATVTPPPTLATMAASAGTASAAFAASAGIPAVSVTLAAAAGPASTAFVVTASGGNLPPDLVAAVVARLRDQGVGTALGEAGPVKKIWSDSVMGSPPTPWLEITETGGTREYQASGGYIERGQLEISVVAAGKLQARQLAELVANPGSDTPGALDDPPLVWTGARLMKFRLRSWSFEKIPGPGPSSPALYHRLMAFDVWYSGRIA